MFAMANAFLLPSSPTMNYNASNINLPQNARLQLQLDSSENQFSMKMAVIEERIAAKERTLHQKIRALEKNRRRSLERQLSSTSLGSLGGTGRLDLNDATDSNGQDAVVEQSAASRKKARESLQKMREMRETAKERMRQRKGSMGSVSFLFSCHHLTFSVSLFSCCFRGY